MDPIVVSGAQGLLGRSILQSLQRDFPGSQIIALARSPVDVKGIKTVIWNLPKQIPNSQELPLKFHYIHTANLLKSEDLSQFYEINCRALKKFLDRFQEQISSVIWSSSLSVLGQGPFFNANENDLQAPSTALAQSRFAQEEIILDFCKNKNLGCFGLRARLYIGPSEKEFNSYLRLLLRKPFLAFNGGRVKISVISIEDYAKIVSELLAKMSDKREIFNIAYKSPLCIANFLKLYGLSPRWTFPARVLKVVLFFLPQKNKNSLQTKLELLGQDQVMDVSKLESFLQTKLLSKDPLNVICQYIKQP